MVPSEGRYKCIRSFSFENDNFDGPDFVTATKGTIWSIGDDDFVGGEVHLDNETDESWIEIGLDDLGKYFLRLEVDSDGTR